MNSSNINDESSCEDRDISIEEFWRTEIQGSKNSRNDLDLIANSNENLQYLEVNREFMKFSDYINRPLYRDDFGDLLIPTFRLLYLLLLSNNGKSEAEKFFVRFNYLFSSDFEDLLRCETCKDAQKLLKSNSRITVKLTKRAYRSLLNWIKGNFSETSKMVNILRVLHENFHFDIQKDKEASSVDGKQLMEEFENWLSVQIKPSKNSEQESKDTAKASSRNNVQSDKTQGAQKKSEPYLNLTCEESVDDSQSHEAKRSRKMPEAYVDETDEESVDDNSPTSSMFVMKPSARRYLQKVKNSGLSIEQMAEALLSPPSDDEDEDTMMEFSDGGSACCSMYQ